ncbi:MAG: HNH endonuclease signature motif containing protein [Sphaerochaetaceae bacterium]
MEEKQGAQVKMKRCNRGTQCLTGNPLQPIINFSRRKISPDGHTYTCKTCEAASARESYARRKDKIKKKPQTPEEREKRLEYHREHYRQNRERKLSYDKEYQATARGKKVMQKAHAKRRQALKEMREERDYTRNEIIARDSIDGVLTCKICGKPIEKLADLHIDHIKPIVEGGRDVADNVRCTHSWCNLTRPKDARDLEQTEEASNEE